MRDLSNIDNNTTISVVIPVYNALPYLQTCIESVLRQSHTDLEVLLIDDGSTDGSSETCDQYEKSDHRVRVVHQPNRGVSASRNNGIDLATGEYLLFVDADDYIHESMIERLLTAVFPDHSLAICGYSTFKSEIPSVEYGTLEEVQAESRIISTDEALEDMLYEKLSTNSPWAKLFHRSLFDTLRFPAIHIAEDFAIMYKLYSKAPDVAKVDYPYYYYRVHDGSAIHSTYQPDRMNALILSYEMVDFIDKYHPLVSPAAVSRLFMEVVYILQNMTVFKAVQFPGNYNSCRDVLKETRLRVIKDKDSKYRHRIYAALSFIGAWPIALSGNILLLRQFLKKQFHL